MVNNKRNFPFYKTQSSEASTTSESGCRSGSSQGSLDNTKNVACCNHSNNSNSNGSIEPQPKRNYTLQCNCRRSCCRRHNKKKLKSDDRAQGSEYSVEVDIGEQTEVETEDEPEEEETSKAESQNKSTDEQMERISYSPNSVRPPILNRANPGEIQAGSSNTNFYTNNTLTFNPMTNYNRLEGLYTMYKAYKNLRKPNKFAYMLIHTCNIILQLHSTKLERYHNQQQHRLERVASALALAGDDDNEDRDRDTDKDEGLNENHVKLTEIIEDLNAVPPQPSTSPRSRPHLQSQLQVQLQWIPLVLPAKFYLIFADSLFIMSKTVVAEAQARSNRVHAEVYSNQNRHRRRRVSSGGSNRTQEDDEEDLIREKVAEFISAAVEQLSIGLNAHPKDVDLLFARSHMYIVQLNHQILIRGASVLRAYEQELAPVMDMAVNDFELAEEIIFNGNSDSDSPRYGKAQFKTIKMILSLGQYVGTHWMMGFSAKQQPPVSQQDHQEEEGGSNNSNQQWIWGEPELRSYHEKYQEWGKVRYAKVLEFLERTDEAYDNQSHNPFLYTTKQKILLKERAHLGLGRYYMNKAGPYVEVSETRTNSSTSILSARSNNEAEEKDQDEDQGEKYEENYQEDSSNAYRHERMKATETARDLMVCAVRHLLQSEPDIDEEDLDQAARRRQQIPSLNYQFNESESDENDDEKEDDAASILSLIADSQLTLANLLNGPGIQIPQEAQQELLYIEAGIRTRRAITRIDQVKRAKGLRLRQARQRYQERQRGEV